MIFGLLELFQADGDLEWLDWADTLQQRMDERFWDPSRAAGSARPARIPSVLLRLKEDYDGAEPSAGALASLNLLTLSNLLPDDGRDGAIGAGAGEIRRTPRGSGAGRSARRRGRIDVDRRRGAGRRVARAGSGDESTALRSALAGHYLPFIVAVPVTDTTRDELAAQIAVHRVAAGKGRRGDGVSSAATSCARRRRASVEALESALLAR